MESPSPILRAALEALEEQKTWIDKISQDLARRFIKNAQVRSVYLPEEQRTVLALTVPVEELVPALLQEQRPVEQIQQPQALLEPGEIVEVPQSSRAMAIVPSSLEEAVTPLQEIASEEVQQKQLQELEFDPDSLVSQILKKMLPMKKLVRDHIQMQMEEQEKHELQEDLRSQEDELQIIRKIPRRRPEAPAELPSFVDPMVDVQKITEIAALTKTPIVRKILLNILQKRRGEERRITIRDKLRPFHYETSGEVFQNRLRRYLQPNELEQFIQKDVRKAEQGYYGLVDYIHELEKLAAEPGRFRKITTVRYNPRTKKEEQTIVYQGLTSSGIVTKSSGLFVPDKPYKQLSDLYSLTLALQCMSYGQLTAVPSQNQISTLESELDRKLQERRETTSNLNRMLLSLRERGIDPLTDPNYQGSKQIDSLITISAEQIGRKLQALRDVLQQVTSQSYFYIPEKERESFIAERPEAANLPENEFILEYLRARHPKDFENISKARKTLLFKSTAGTGQKLLNPLTGVRESVETMPRDIVAEYIKTYLPDPRTYNFLNELVRWILSISQPDEKEGEIYNVLAFEPIPDDWFEDAERYDSINAHNIRQLQTDYTVKLCNLIYRALGSYDRWCDVHLQKARRSAEEEYVPSMPEMGVQIEMANVYPNLAVLPSRAEKISLGPSLQPDFAEGILSLATLQPRDFGYDTKLGYFSRLSDVLQKEGRPVSGIPDRQSIQFRHFVDDFWRQNISDREIGRVIADYVSKVLGKKIGTLEFAASLNEQYQRFQEKEGNTPRIFWPPSPFYFPKTAEGDKSYMEVLKTLGYIGEGGYEPYLQTEPVPQAALQRQQYDVLQFHEGQMRWQMVPALAKEHERMEKNIANWRDFISRNLQGNKSKLSPEVLERALEDVQNAATRPLDLVQFAVAAFPLKDPTTGSIGAPPVIGNKLPSSVKSFRDVFESLGSSSSFEESKDQFNKRLITQVDRTIGGFDPSVIGKIPPEYFLLSELSPGFYDSYSQSYDQKLSEYNRILETELSQLQTADYIKRLRRLLSITRT